MYASLVVLALTGFTTAAAPSAAPAWDSDYTAAVAKGSAEGKPLAVFIGSGKAGWNKLSQDGTLGDETQKLLKTSYVCVYVDASTVDGKAMATAFQVPEGVGIIISDRTGKLQAFRHEGDFPETTLVGYLARFSDPSLVVDTTVTNPPRRSYYGPATSGYGTSGYCPTCSGCPGGNCYRR